MWKKRGKAITYEDFIIERTGRNIQTMQNCFRNYMVGGLAQIAEVFKKASAEKIKITAVGDYDVDGVCSLLIMAKILSYLRISFELITPKRISEGYGLSPKIMERISEGIVITIDNGIAAVEAVQIAREKGLFVIIMDHHIAGADLPNANIIVDPSTLPGTADFDFYCGAGLAFKLAEHIIPSNHPLLSEINGLAALATIGDSVALIEDNRQIVINGLKCLKSGFCSEGTRLLMEACKIDAFSTAVDVGFNLVPCINAPGRLLDDGAKLAVQALWSNQNDKATGLVDELVRYNTQRKEIIKQIMSEIDMEALKSSTDNCVFYFGENLPEGVAGLLAGKFANETNKPTIVLVRTENGTIKGSCRVGDNCDDVNLKESLDRCKDVLLRYGGHKKAAAVSLEEKNLNIFEKMFSDSLPVFVKDDSKYYDLEIKAGELPDMAKFLESMEPFGEGNPKPVFFIRNVKVGNNYGETVSFMGAEKQHIRLNFKSFKAIGFHMAEKYHEIYPEPKEPTYVDIYGYAEINHFKGKEYPQFHLLDFAESM